MKTTLTEMKKADVRFVSLVERGANRIPFRIVKSEKESTMIDLSNPGRIFKRDKAAPTGSSVVGIVVKSQKDDAANAAVTAALTEAGFKVDNATKNEDGTIVFAQDGAIDTEGTHLVRLSDEMVVVMKGFAPYSTDMDASTDFSEVMACQGFYQGINTATDALATTIRNALYSASSGADAAKTMSASFSKFQTYVVALLNGIPSKAFKADTALIELAVKGTTVAEDDAKAKAQQDANKDTRIGAELTPLETKLNAPNIAKTDEPVAAAAGTEGGAAPAVAAVAAPAAAAVVEDPAAAAELVEKGKGKHVAAGSAAAADPGASEQTVEAEQKIKDAAKAKKEEDDAALASLIGAAVKAATEPLLLQVTQLSEAQETLKSELANVARKSEDTTKAIKGTVLAAAATGLDTPAPAQVQKSEGDGDWRTGAFDSANHRRN